MSIVLWYEASPTRSVGRGVSAWRELAYEVVAHAATVVQRRFAMYVPLDGMSLHDWSLTQ
jgi:hypothetical protein